LKQNFSPVQQYHIPNSTRATMPCHIIKHDKQVQLIISLTYSPGHKNPADILSIKLIVIYGHIYKLCYFQMM